MAELFYVTKHLASSEAEKRGQAEALQSSSHVSTAEASNASARGKTNQSCRQADCAPFLATAFAHTAEAELGRNHTRYLNWSFVGIERWYLATTRHASVRYTCMMIMCVTHSVEGAQMSARNEQAF